MMKKISLGLLSVIGALSVGMAQNGNGDITIDELAGAENTIKYSVPFLTIAPDSRAGAMGDAEWQHPRT